MPSWTALGTAGTLMPHHNPWCHLPLVDAKLLKPFYIHYLPTEWPETQSCISASHLSGAVQPQSSAWYSSLLPLSLHIRILMTLYLFVKIYRLNPTHIWVLNRREQYVKLFCLSMQQLWSHLFSTDFFSIPYCYWKEDTTSKWSQVGPFSRNVIFSCLENRLPLTPGIRSHICGCERDVRERWVNKAHRRPAADFGEIKALLKLLPNDFRVL